MRLVPLLLQVRVLHLAALRLRPSEFSCRVRCSGWLAVADLSEEQLPWFLDEEYRALVAAEAATPADIAAAATEANRVALVAA
jgi:hypothetical protein